MKRGRLSRRPVALRKQSRDYYVPISGRLLRANIQALMDGSGWQDVPLHRVWEYRDIGRLFITVGGEESDNRGAEVGLGGGDSPGQSGGHSPQPPATLR